MNIPTSFHAARELFRVKASGSEFVELVHAATNQDPWGPTGTQMDDVCRAFMRGSVEIMDEIKLRLKQRDKAWRPCYKSLLLLDHLARNVPESGLPVVCSVASIVRQISQSYYYTGSKGTDHGLSVRERAKKLCDLLSDGALLREEREKAAMTRSKLSSAFANDAGGYASSRYQGISSRFSPPIQTFTAYETFSPSLTREEQERRDRELALRLQRDEESHAGMSVAEVERIFSRYVQRQPPAEVAQFARDADLELARRLEKEQEKKEQEKKEERGEEGHQARLAAEPLAPAKSTVPAGTPSPKPETAPLKPEPTKVDLLDDLFASATVTNSSNFQSSAWNASTPGQQQQASAPIDLFDEFLNSRIGQQQQQQQQRQQQMPPPLFSQPQQVSYGGFQPEVTQQQQYSGMTAGGGWNSGPQVLTPMPSMGGNSAWSGGIPMQASSEGISPQGVWGVPSSTGSSCTFNAPQQAPITSTGNNVRGCAPSNNTSGGLSSMNNLEQQMAQFAGTFTHENKQPTKSLDVLMAERRAA